MAGFQLIGRIIDLSVANNWDDACAEWDLHSIYKADEPETCLCGKYPIIEVCVLRNRKNFVFAEVGNCCVKKFMGLPSRQMFDGLRRVKRDPLKSLNRALIEHSREKGWLTDWEYGFYKNIMRKRNLSQKQIHYKTKINEKVLSRITKKK